MSNIPSIFTTRAPRNRKEIETCIAMVSNSPLGYENNSYYKLNRKAIAETWHNLLILGYGSIEIIENKSYFSIFEQHTKAREHYDHHFHSCFFTYHITYEVAREIVAKKDLQDINKYLLESHIAYENEKRPCPFMTKIESNLCIFSFFVVHPEIEFLSDQVLGDAPAYVERLRRDMILLTGGIKHLVMIMATYSEFLKTGVLGFGQKLLREYEGNETRPVNAKKYLFCLTKNSEIAEALGISDPLSVQSGQGTGYDLLFITPKQPLANLNHEEQQLCYFIAIGYKSTQILKAREPQVEYEGKYRDAALRRLRIEQHRASEKLYDAGYTNVADLTNGKLRYPRENLQEVIRENLHEARSFIVPWYPWPD